MTCTHVPLKPQRKVHRLDAGTPKQHGQLPASLRLLLVLGLLQATSAAAAIHLAPTTMASAAGSGLASNAVPAIDAAALQPVEFDQIPGWRDDNLLASLRGLRQSCVALTRQPEWALACADIAQLGADTEQARQFYQRHFQAYRISAPGTQPDTISGYFEPELQGSRERSGSYQFPVYGPPRDLLKLDGRILTGADRQVFVVEGGQLRLPRTDDTLAREYRLDLAGLRADGRDVAYRVRIEGDRILSYYSRQEIAARLLDAPVLAWVQDPLALESLQQQAGGRLRLAGGETVGLQPTEDNGQPLPPRSTAFEPIAASGQPLTRGSRGGAGGRPAKSLSDEELFQLIASVDAEAEAAAKPKAQPAASQRSGRTATVKPARQARPAATPSSPRDGARDAGREAEIAAMVAALSRPTNPATAATPVSVPPAEPPAPVAAVMAAEPPADARPTPPTTNDYLRPEANAHPQRGDAGYLFFRADDSGQATRVGSLGVPLTAGRSISVDQRRVPPGSPVFISVGAPGSQARLQRLAFAQDSLPASGPADVGLYWGSGESARRLAEATGGPTQMWLLLPRGQAPH